MELRRKKKEIKVKEKNNLGVQREKLRQDDRGIKQNWILFKAREDSN